MPSPPGQLLAVEGHGATTHRFVPYTWNDTVYRVATESWGDPASPRTVVCVHGLTRRATDFETLAQHLARDGNHVVSIDLPGRGRSDWLSGPDDYEFAPYLQAITAVLDLLAAPQVDWIGTSLGGLLGMTVACQQPHRIRRLVMNDIGPFLPKDALERIAGYADGEVRYHDLADAEQRLRRVLAPYGIASDKAWERITLTSLRRLPDGTLGPQFDPAIATKFGSTTFEDVDLWGLWALVTCPVLVIRGEQSDLLSEETVTRMVARGQVDAHRVPQAGHAPMLDDPPSLAAIARFLASA